jgi:hypothetical protein
MYANRIPISVSIFGECATLVQKKTRWGSFVESLQDIGYEIIPIGQTQASFYISVDHTQKHFEIMEKLLDRSQLLLIAIEPPSINPSQFKAIHFSKYSQIITIPSLESFFPAPLIWCPGFIDNSEFLENADVPALESRPYNFGILATNKYSFFDSNLYSLRKSILHEFTKRKVHVVVGGRNWNRTKSWNLMQYLKTLILELPSLNFRTINLGLHSLLLRKKHLDLWGPVENEIEFYKQFKFIICIESDRNDFSEKLFDVNLAGSIALYVGPLVEDFGVPKSAIIHMPNSAFEFVEQAVKLANTFEPHPRFLTDNNRYWLLDWEAKESFLNLANLCLRSHK